MKIDLNEKGVISPHTQHTTYFYINKYAHLHHNQTNQNISRIEMNTIPILDVVRCMHSFTYIFPGYCFLLWYLLCKLIKYTRL